MKIVFTDKTELECSEVVQDSYIKFPAAMSVDLIRTVFTKSSLEGADVMEGEEPYLHFTGVLFTGRIEVMPAEITAYIRRITETELLIERVRQLEEARDVTDEAISDLGMAISEIAKGGM